MERIHINEIIRFIRKYKGVRHASVSVDRETQEVLFEIIPYEEYHSNHYIKDLFLCLYIESGTSEFFHSKYFKLRGVGKLTDDSRIFVEEGDYKELNDFDGLYYFKVKHGYILTHTVAEDRISLYVTYRTLDNLFGYLIVNVPNTESPTEMMLEIIDELSYNLDLEDNEFIVDNIINLNRVLKYKGE